MSLHKLTAGAGYDYRESDLVAWLDERVEQARLRMAT